MSGFLHVFVVSDQRHFVSFSFIFFAKSKNYIKIFDNLRNYLLLCTVFSDNRTKC